MKRSFTFLSYYLSSLSIFGLCLPQSIESYYTVKDYESPHFHVESLAFDQSSFVELVNEVHRMTHNRAFMIEVPNKLYSENAEKLRAANFFYYFDYPERDASVWCRTNGSGIPLVASHTLGAHSLVYYKENSEYFFLLIKDKYGYDEYEFPGGYVQPDDGEIVDAFEKGLYKTINLDYRSPEETGISEVLEETGFDLTKYGYGTEGSKKPLIIAQVYTKNTRPAHGIHSVNDCCQYLLFCVNANKDSLRKQDHEVLDTRWASYTEIINDQIDSPIGIHTTTDHVKILVERVVAADKYKETRNNLTEINKKIRTLISSNNIEINALKKVLEEQSILLDLQKQLETKLKQCYSQSGKKSIRYFTPL